MSTIFNLIDDVMKKMGEQLPQAEHAKNILLIEEKITELTQAMEGRSVALMEERITFIRSDLHSKKQAYEKELQELNGQFFQDPKSLLKQAWDAAVEHVYNALHTEVHVRSDLDDAHTKIENAVYETSLMVKARESIELYICHEHRRNEVQALLHEIISIEKTDAVVDPCLSLEKEREDLEARQKQLCGNYYQDPSGLLDQKWKELQSAGEEANRAKLQEAFNALEEERKNNDARLFELQRQIALAKAPKDIHALAIAGIQKEKEALDQQLQKEVQLHDEKISPPIDETNWITI